MAIVKAISGKNKGSLARIINYIYKTEKTEEKLRDSFNCANDTSCIQQMNRTKDMYNKNKGRMYKHFVISYSNQDFRDNDGNFIDGATDKAHAISMELLNDD